MLKVKRVGIYILDSIKSKEIGNLIYLVNSRTKHYHKLSDSFGRLDSAYTGLGKDAQQKLTQRDSSYNALLKDAEEWKNIADVSCSLLNEENKAKVKQLTGH